jgi:hypothetical protein
MKILYIRKILWLLLIGFATTVWGIEMSDEILTNHVGYSPGAAKYCLMTGDNSRGFKIVDTQSGATAYQGMMQAHEGVFGKYLVGAFTELAKEGTYRIEVDGKRSAPFSISKGIYDDAIKKCVTYFSIQRCGPSTTGYAAPCHIDDGRRLDTGPGWTMQPHRDVSGGWHDAGDYRKWVAFTLFGMTGLGRVYEIQGPEWNGEQILEELRWGNRYFLAMQNDAGYVMNFCGGDDGMYLSDNQIGTEDDRPIHTEPASFVHNNVDRTAQYNFIIAEALAGRIFQSSDPDYAKKCIDAALRCLEWCNKNYYANNTLEMGAALLACVELYKTTEETQFLEEAIDFANRLLELQVIEPIDDTYKIRGFFKTSSREPEPSRHSWHGPQHIVGLCILNELVPDHEKAQEWKEAVRMYYEEYVMKLAGLNNFYLTPIGLYLSQDPGGGHKIGDYWVRYLTVTANNAWGGGINSNAASTGIGMMYASKLLKNEKLKIYAQKQLDWIIGSNPLNMSTAEGIGHNQPLRFINRTLNIPPLIPGAVMNGIGGTIDDMPDLKEGSWQNCEYHTPKVAQTMWLMAVLQKELQ